MQPFFLSFSLAIVIISAFIMHNLLCSIMVFPWLFKYCSIRALDHHLTTKHLTYTKVRCSNRNCTEGRIKVMVNIQSPIPTSVLFCEKM